MIELDVVTTACCTDERPDLIGADRAAGLAEVFKALADPTRVRLLEHISRREDGTACACHLPEALGISQPTMSHHMQKLVKAGLVTREQRGRWAHYTVVAEALADARALLDGAARSWALPDSNR